jgi:hypothetical protein
MIKPEQIPPEAWKATGLPELAARAAIAAALAAWPNAKTLRDDGRRQTYIVPALVLPLAQEARDD